MVPALVIVDIITLISDKRKSVKVKDTDEFTSLHISTAGGNLKAMNVFVVRGVAISNVKKIWCHSIHGGCTNWQIVIRLFPHR